MNLISFQKKMNLFITFQRWIGNESPLLPDVFSTYQVFAYVSRLISRTNKLALKYVFIHHMSPGI